MQIYGYMFQRICLKYNCVDVQHMSFNHISNIWYMYMIYTYQYMSKTYTVVYCIKTYALYSMNLEYQIKHTSNIKSNAYITLHTIKEQHLLYRPNIIHSKTNHRTPYLYIYIAYIFILNIYIFKCVCMCIYIYICKYNIIQI